MSEKKIEVIDVSQSSSWIDSNVNQGIKTHILKKPKFGGSIHLAKLTKGATLPVHAHPKAEHVYILKGHLKFGEYELHESTFVTIPGGGIQGPYEAVNDVELLIIREGELGETLPDY